MGSCYQCSPTDCGSREPAQQIPARVDRYGEAGGCKLSLQPRSALGKLRSKGTAGPGFCRIGDAAESLHTAPQPIRIDFDHLLEPLSERQIQVLDSFVDFPGVFVTDGDCGNTRIPESELHRSFAVL